MPKIDFSDAIGSENVSDAMCIEKSKITNISSNTISKKLKIITQSIENTFLIFLNNFLVFYAGFAASGSSHTHIHKYTYIYHNIQLPAPLRCYSRLHTHAHQKLRIHLALRAYNRIWCVCYAMPSAHQKLFLLHHSHHCQMAAPSAMASSLHSAIPFKTNKDKNNSI